MGCSLGVLGAGHVAPQRQESYRLKQGQEPAQPRCEPELNPVVAAQSGLQSSVRLRTLVECQDGDKKSAPVTAVAFAANAAVVAHITAVADLVPRADMTQGDGASAPAFVAEGNAAHSMHIADLSAFAPEGRMLLSCGADPWVVVWARSSDADNYSICTKLRLEWADVRKPAVPAPRDSARPLPGLRCVRGSADGLLVAAVLQDESLFAEEMEEMEDEQLGELVEPPRRESVVSAAGRVAVWSVPSGRQTALFCAHQAEVLCMAFTPGGDSIATGSRDGTVLVWKPPHDSGEVTLVTRLSRALQSAVLSCAFSSDGVWLATVDAGALYVWDVRTGQSVFVIRTEECRVPGFRAVGFVGQYHVVAAAAGVPRVVVIDAVTATSLARVNVPAPVSCVASWGRTAQVAVGDVDGGIHVLQLLGVGC
eukprot:TRINITY_DN14882_c0_g1_i1.p1 TRINITY_DN14882_c0_g1~~TRINITY_DN14882_c0_g1_i1.p1  ORF type:complete len:448 (+),score=129.51 TRINITY_DN14882_c0_g1_i1:78-1346(+)